jgi:drug/metabolite transporter (DMT)-like permease
MAYAYLYLMLLQFCYAVPLILSQPALEQIPIFLFLELTFIVSFLVLLPLSMKEKVKWSQLGRKNILNLFIQGVLLNVLLNFFLMFGHSRTSATATGIIVCTTPAFILILSFFFLRERIKMMSIIAILLSMAGVALQSFITFGESPKVTLLGNLFVILAVLTQASFVIYSKKYAADVPPITTAAIVQLVGVVLFIPLALMDGYSLQWSSVSVTNWWLTILYGVAGNALAMLFYYLAIKKVTAKTVGIFQGLLPIITTMTAVLALGEPFNVILVVSTLCVLLSILIGVLSEKKIESEFSSPPLKE